MTPRDKMICSGPGGCGHPRLGHDGTHVKGSRTACTQPLGNGRARCACKRFKDVRTTSSDSRKAVVAADD